MGSDKFIINEQVKNEGAIISPVGQTEDVIEPTESSTDMVKKTTKKTKTPKRRRVSFYIHPKGSSRRKRVSFLVRR